MIETTDLKQNDYLIMASIPIWKKRIVEAEKIITEARVEFKKKQENSNLILGLNQLEGASKMMSSGMIFLIIIGNQWSK